MLSRKNINLNVLTLLVILFFIFLNSLSQAQWISDCPTNLTDYWKLDETSGSTFSDSVGGNDASCTGGTDCPGFTSGKINNALRFDGMNTGIKVFPAASFDWGSDDSFSIEFWMKTDPASTCAGENQVIVGRDDSSTQLHWWVGCRHDSGVAAFQLSDKNGYGISIKGSTDLTDGFWHHIVAVRDDLTKENRLYVDGVREGLASISYSRGFDSAKAPLNIGWLNLDSGYHFAGKIDEIALHKGALSDVEIRSHYYLSRGYCDMCTTNIRIMPLGDSITYGRNDPALEPGGSGEPNYVVGYRQQLYLSLLDAGYYFDFVGSLQDGELAEPTFDIDHQGQNGFTAQEMAANVYNFLSDNPAEVVLCHIGTNNIDSLSTTDINNILNEVDRFSTDITVALARIINVRDIDDSRRPYITQFNNDVSAMAMSRTNDKIIVVDQEHALTYPDDMWGELHPNGAGYNKMASVWKSALDDFLPTCAEIAPVIISTPITEAYVGLPYSNNVDATGNPVPTYNLATAPTDMTVSAGTGLIDWTPPTTGSFDVTVQASNGVGTATQSFTIEVVEPPPCPSDMVHYWKLDETSGLLYYDFFGGADAACTSCPMGGVGVINGAQQFDTASVVNVADDNTFDWGASSSFSIEFWMKTDPASTCAGKNQVIVGRDDSSTQLHWWVGCRHDSGVAAFYLGDKGGQGILMKGGTDLTDGFWHHIVAVRDDISKENRLYVDGVREGLASISYSRGFDSAKAPLNIGWLNLDSGYHFKGILDEVALYNRALSALEILQHYTYGFSNIGYCEPVAPSIISTPITTAVKGQPYTYDVEAMGNPAPNYSLVTAPSGMTINASTGMILWTPSTTGPFDVAVQASNGVGTDTHSFAIQVNEVPHITSHPITAAVVGQPYAYGVDATGVPAPTYSLVTAPSGMTINASTGVISWTPSSAGSFNVKVKATNEVGTDTQSFTITVNTIKLLSPDGGEIISSGSNWTIRWVALPDAVKFKLQYSVDNGLTWIPINTDFTQGTICGSDKCYDWTVPAQLGNKKNKCLVKVKGYNVSSVKVCADVSDAPFTIEVVKVTSPNGGEVLTCGVDNSITWTTNAIKGTVTKVKLYYTKDAGTTWNLITALPSNDGSYDLWKPACTKPKPNCCKIKVDLKDALGNILGTDKSDNYFTIQP